MTTKKDPCKTLFRMQIHDVCDTTGCCAGQHRGWVSDYYSESKKSLANVLQTKLIVEEDWKEVLRDDLEDRFEHWMSSQGWPSEVDAAEYAKLKKENVDDRVMMPDSIEELVELCQNVCTRTCGLFEITIATIFLSEESFWLKNINLQQIRDNPDAVVTVVRII